VSTRVSAGPPEARTASPGPRSPPDPAGAPVVCGHKGLPSAPGFRYNPHSLYASGSVQPVLPGGPGPGVVGLFCEGPAG